MKRSILIAGIIFTIISGFSQPQAGIEVYKKVMEDEIRLKFVPQSPADWYEGTQNGYVIERRVKDSGEDFELLTPEPVLPATEEEMQQLAQENPTVRGMIRQLYGLGAPMPDESTFPAMEDQRRQLSGRAFLYFYLSCLSSRASQVSGMEFSDIEIDPNTDYEYRVSIKGSDDVSGIITVSSSQNTLYDLPSLFTEGLDKLVKIRWNHNAHNKKYVAYRVEKSTDKKNWSYLGNEPIIYNDNMQEAGNEIKRGFIYESDSIDENYKPYYYKLKGIDFFGERHKSAEVNTVKGRDMTPPVAPSSVNAEYKPGNIVEITWKYPSFSDDHDFAGFHIGTSENPNGPFTKVNDKLLPKGADIFLHNNPVKNGRNYYIVTALDTAGNFKNSLPVYVPIPDTTPPSVPAGLTGKADTAGVVTISWNMGSEKDLRGYRLYKANRPDHEFVQITKDPLQDTVFTDTLALKTLSKKIYYKVTALDRVFNHSDFSNPIQVKRPDVMPPVSPQIKNIRVSNDQIHIKWTASSSKDIEKHILLTENEEGQWQRHAELKMNEAEYTMPFPDEKNAISFAMIAMDDSGLISDTSEIRIAEKTSFYKVAPVDELQAIVPENQGLIEISWEHPASSDELFFILYKGEANGGLKMYETTKGNKTSFTDEWVKKGQEYHYAVKVKRKDGKTSRLSKSVSIKISENE